MHQMQVAIVCGLLSLSYTGYYHMHHMQVAIVGCYSMWVTIIYFFGENSNLV